jgi:hypothetical protein
MHAYFCARRYEELPKSGEAFEGLAVAVIGFGNAALEAVNSMAPYVNYVHMFAGECQLSPASWVHIACLFRLWTCMSVQVVDVHLYHPPTAQHTRTHAHHTRAH